MTDASGRETAAFHIPAEADLQACTCGNGLSGTGFGNGLRGRAFGNGLSGTTRGTDFRKRYAGNRPAGLIPSAEKGFCRISKYIYPVSYTHLPGPQGPREDEERAGFDIHRLDGLCAGDVFGRIVERPPLVPWDNHKSMPSK